MILILNGHVKVWVFFPTFEAAAIPNASGFHHRGADQVFFS
jgi:hypothetical protein